MTAPNVFIVPRTAPPPDPSPPPWPDQLQHALAFALLDLSNLETQIYNGQGGGLRLRREQAEAKVNDLRAQLAGVRRG